MLQIIIMHETNKVYVMGIRHLDTMDIVSQFDKTKSMIDLEPLVSHVGESVMITHFIKENGCIRLDYEHIRTISKVDKDEYGSWFVEYH